MVDQTEYERNLAYNDPAAYSRLKAYQQAEQERALAAALSTNAAPAYGLGQQGAQQAWTGETRQASTMIGQLDPVSAATGGDLTLWTASPRFDASTPWLDTTYTAQEAQQGYGARQWQQGITDTLMAGALQRDQAALAQRAQTPQINLRGVDAALADRIRRESAADVTRQQRLLDVQAQQAQAQAASAASGQARDLANRSRQQTLDEAIANQMAQEGITGLDQSRERERATLQRELTGETLRAAGAGLAQYRG